MGFGIINPAPVRETVCPRQSANAGAHVSSRRRGRSRNRTLLSVAITAVMVSVGLSAITHFILAAILNPAATSKANNRWTESTASIAAAPLPKGDESIVPRMAVAPARLSPEKRSDAMQSAEPRLKAPLATHRERGETIVPKKAIAPARLPLEKKSDAMQSAGPRPKALPATHRESNSDSPSRMLAPIAITEETTQLDRLTNVFQTEPHNAKAANDRSAGAQQRPEQKQLAAVGLKQEPGGAEQPQPEVTETVPTPKPRPTMLAAKEPNTPTRSAQVTTDVNMRTGPRKSAAVVTTVRAGREVEVIMCMKWCEVTFDGKRGWIYKRFVREPTS